MYQETLDFLYTQLPQYQKEGKTAYKASLNNILAISYLIGDPHKKIKSIHIAGTNGKGSTAHMLASVLQEAGYKVGLYTSPHLVDFRERIKINGTSIKKKNVVEFVEKNKAILIDIKPSFFEWTVGLAFNYFAEKEVDIAVIETGLGGRLDSTNIITPELSIITNIGLEHTNILGNTLPKIALEKAGIIKDEVPVVIGETQEEVKPVFIEKAKALNSPIYFADEHSIENIPSTDLKGDYQAKNVRTVLKATELLLSNDWKIPQEALNNGLNNVISNTKLLGRWQQINNDPITIVDVAHNANGIKEALNNLKSYSYKNLHIVIGLSSDKDREAIYKLLPTTASYYFCSGANNRLIEALPLKYEAIIHDLRGSEFESPKKALKKATKSANEDDLILILGSNFIVGELLETINS